MPRLNIVEERKPLDSLSAKVLRSRTDSMKSVTCGAGSGRSLRMPRTSIALPSLSVIVNIWLFACSGVVQVRIVPSGSFTGHTVAFVPFRNGSFLSDSSPSRMTSVPSA